MILNSKIKTCWIIISLPPVKKLIRFTWIVLCVFLKIASFHSKENNRIYKNLAKVKSDKC